MTPLQEWRNLGQILACREVPGKVATTPSGPDCRNPLEAPGALGLRERGKGMSRLLLAGLGLAIVLQVLVSCSQEKATSVTTASLPVNVAVSTRQSVPVELHAVGQVEASTTVTVRSQVAGVIATVHFHEGDEVKKGNLLFTLDPTPFRAALAKAEADLQQNRVEAANARRDAQRYAQLLGEGFVSRGEADSLQSRAESLDAALAASRASVDNARIQLGYTDIRAPQGGRTGALLVHPGTVVKANDVPDLVTINTLRPVLVTFSIPERSLPALRQQLKSGELQVTALPQGDDRPPAAGHISFLNNSVDPATGTIRLKASFANRDQRLWPGQFVAVTVVLETLKDAVVVPAAAVQTGQQGSYLFVVDADQKVTMRPVSPSISWNDLTVIASGLEPGETVVTAGQLRLYPGARITVKAADSKVVGDARP